MSNHIKTITNDFLSVQINLQGAELWSIQDREGKEYLWQGDPQSWSDKAPTLFPYIARMTEKSYTFNGQTYEMDIHGFAKDTLFQLIDHEEDRLTLHMGSTEETLKQYPFRFDFFITFRLVANKLVTEYTVRNLDSYTMYFGIGGHPGFQVPLDDGLTFQDYYLEFHEKSTPNRVIFSEDCFVMDGQFVPFPLQEEQKYFLHHDMFNKDAIVLTDMPRQITLCSDKGKRRVRVSYPDMPYLGLWHWPRTEVPYICIEPWSSLPSRKGIVEDLEKQENLIALPAGESYKNIWSIEILG